MLLNNGVITAKENGYFKFYDSDIYKNYALTSPISEILSSQQESVIDGCRITNNIALTIDYIKNTLLNEGNLKLLIYKFRLCLSRL